MTPLQHLGFGILLFFVLVFFFLWAIKDETEDKKSDYGEAIFVLSFFISLGITLLI